jgi:hypothetical protein
MTDKNMNKLLGFPNTPVLLPLLLQLHALFEVCAAPNANGSNNAADRCRVTIYLQRPIVLYVKTKQKKEKNRVFKAVVVLGQKKQKLIFFKD